MGRAERRQITTQPCGETTGALSPLVGGGGKEGVLKAMVFYLGSEDENQFTGQRGRRRGEKQYVPDRRNRTYVKAWF